MFLVYKYIFYTLYKKTKQTSSLFLRAKLIISGIISAPKISSHNRPVSSYSSNQTL